MSSNDGGFLAAWGDSSQQLVKLLQVRVDGGSSALVSEASTAAVDVVVGGAGEQWVLVWRDGNGLPSKCTSSVDSGVVTIDSGMVDPIRQGVAISPGGAVGAIAFESSSSSAWYGQSALGCPVEYTTRRSAFNVVQGVNALRGPSGFVYTLSADSVDGELHVFSAPDAGKLSFGLERMGDHSSAISDDGSFVQLVAGLTPDGLSLRSLLSNQTQPVQLSPTYTLGGDVAWWNSYSCGSDCFAIAYVERTDAGQASVKVLFTDVTSTPRAVPVYDAVCSVPATAGVAVGHYGDTLGVLVTRATSVELLLCDVPPP
jgi:hypothetical protein